MVICRGYPAGECPPKSEPLAGAQKDGSLTLADFPPQLPICEGTRVFRGPQIVNSDRLFRSPLKYKRQNVKE